MSVDPSSPELFGFPLGAGDEWQLHHAAPFAAVSWTNLFDPARAILFDDVISGAVGPAFGPGVVDVDLRALRGQSRRFSHTRYWSMAETAPGHITALRDALDLAGQRVRL